MKRKLLHSETPCPEPLRSALIRILAGHGIRRGEVEFVKRIEHARVSSNYSNVISCGLSGGRVLRLFGKYTESSPEEGHGDSGYGHWGGVAYEAEVYRQVLRHTTVTCPKFYGVYRDEETGRFALFIEYLEGGWFVTSHSDPPRSMGRASRWLGRFHAENEHRLGNQSWPFLKRYDAEYYLGWARRTSQFAGDLHRRYPWLARLCEQFEEAAAILQESPPTVIHGEFYPHNVLYHGEAGEAIYPLDWESAAVAFGEIDLAALTEGWADDIIDACWQEYVSARWPGDQAAGDRWRFTAAQLFLQFRWLGDQEDWTVDEENRHRFEMMQTAASKLGLL
jgi:aminoglycoside phosphotransferase (APT) family kinase protein